MADNPEHALLETAVSELGVTLEGAVNSSDQGLIASNYFIATNELGPLVVRANEQDQSSGSPSFEARALSFLGTHEAPVPRLVAFQDGSIEKNIEGQRVIAYRPIEGDTIAADAVADPRTTKAAGQLLAQLIGVTEQYTGVESDPDGDIAFIARITSDFLERFPDLQDDEVFNAGVKLLQDDTFAHELAATPHGIVHADYFYENIIEKNDELVGVIDFGDAYHGAILNDIVIGAMEFSVTEADEAWHPELFQTFLAAHANWLRSNSINFELYHKTLLANCVRFAVYTLGFERDEDPQAAASDNRYVQRFAAFSGELEAQLKQTYQRVLEAS